MRKLKPLRDAEHNISYTLHTKQSPALHIDENVFQMPITNAQYPICNVHRGQTEREIIAQYEKALRRIAEIHQRSFDQIRWQTALHGPEMFCDL